MSPYAKTKGSRVRMLGYLAEGEYLRHFTTTRSNGLSGLCTDNIAYLIPGSAYL